MLSLKGSLALVGGIPYLVILAAIGAVFVPYAGVAKVTSVAEEVENPGRNLPLAMARDDLVSRRSNASASGFRPPRTPMRSSPGS